MFANTVVVSLLALLQLPQLILVNIPIFIAIEKRFPITVVEVPRPTKDGLILIHPREDIAAESHQPAKHYELLVQIELRHVIIAVRCAVLVVAVEDVLLYAAVANLVVHIDDGAEGADLVEPGRRERGLVTGEQLVNPVGPSSVSMTRLCDSLTFLSRPSSSMPLYFMVGFLPSWLPVA